MEDAQLLSLREGVEESACTVAKLVNMLKLVSSVSLELVSSVSVCIVYILSLMYLDQQVMIIISISLLHFSSSLLFFFFLQPGPNTLQHIYVIANFFLSF